MELSQETEEGAPAPSLIDQLRLTLYDGLAAEERSIELADRVMALLNETGHYLPGAPPAAQIVKDARSFAERLTLSNLALRVYVMLSGMTVETPETKPARKWMDDYIEGKNHGPVGQAMLWPKNLPGLSHMLRQWGFQPTPTVPPFVARVPGEAPAAVLPMLQ